MGTTEKSPKRLCELRIAGVLGQAGSAGFGYEAEMVSVTLRDWAKLQIDAWPDLFLADAIATAGNRRGLRELTAWCRERGIPTVFWINVTGSAALASLETARHFDYVGAMEAQRIAEFSGLLEQTRVFELPLAVQRSEFYKGYELILELLACGIPLISNDCQEPLLSDQDLRDKLSVIGRRQVFQKHNYRQRLERILTTIELPYFQQEPPGVSVVTSTRRPNYLERVMRNYLSQVYPHKELIVILNDDRMELAEWKKKAEAHPDIRVFQLPEDESLGTCLNFAVERSIHPIIAKFDDDDYYAPEYLTDALQAFSYTEAKIIGKYSSYAYLEDKGILVLRYPGFEHRYLPLVAGSTLIFAKEVWQRIKFRETSLGEDTAFQQEASKAGYRIFATDRFNHVICRRSAGNDHSWRIRDEDFLMKSRRIALTKDYRQFVTI